MNFITILIIIGIVGSIVDSLKSAAKKADEEVVFNRQKESKITSLINKIPLDKVEKYMNEDLLNGIKGFRGKDTQLSNKANDSNINSGDNKPKIEKNKKSEYITPTVNIEIKKPQFNETSKIKKKNPFEITDNPIANAIIAAEIIGKPKCRR
ncbi:MAG: hypothetical protein RR515_03765 [Clostridium sp.]